MVRLTGVQQMTSINTLQGARAYQAALAGLGWAMARINAGGTCADVNAQSAFTLPSLSGFSVRLTCTMQHYTEGEKAPAVFMLNALSEFGAYGGRDYVSRELESSMVKVN